MASFISFYFYFTCGESQSPAFFGVTLIERLADELKKYVHSDMQELDEAIVAFWNRETKSGKRN